MADTNFFGELLTDLQDYLKTAVPSIKWIDQDLGQLEHFEYRPAVDFPCLLIDFSNATYSEEGGLVQFGDVNVMFRLGFAPFSQSYAAAPLDVRQQALGYYDIEQDLFEALQGWNNSFTTPFIRMHADTEHRPHDGLRIRLLTFNTAYEDHSAVPLTTKTPARLVVVPSVVS
jgi:hypothetical protein